MGASRKKSKIALTAEEHESLQRELKDMRNYIERLLTEDDLVAGVYGVTSEETGRLRAAVAALDRVRVLLAHRRDREGTPRSARLPRQASPPAKSRHSRARG